LRARQKARIISEKGDLEKSRYVMSDEAMGPVQVKQVEGSNIVSQDYYAGYTSPLI
jgi:hypothetical protein